MSKSNPSKLVTPQFKNCLFEAYKIPPENFKLPDDGRKWKVNTFNRRTLFLELGSFANGDGSSVRPSISTLMGRTGFCRSKIFNLLDDLKTLGFWEKAGRHGWNGQTIRQLKMPEKPTETQSGSPSFESAASVGVHDSTVEVHDSKMGVHHSGVEVHPRMDSTCPSDLPSRPALPPANQTTVRKTDLEGRLVEMLSAASGKKLWSKAGLSYVLTLAAKYEETESIATVARWLKHRDLTGATCPWKLLANEFEATRREVQADQQRAAVSTTNKKREADFKVEEKAWRERLDALAEQPDLHGCPRGTTKWETELNQWITDNPPPIWEYQSEDGQLLIVEWSNDVIDSAKEMATRYLQDERAKLSAGVPW